MSLLDYYKPLPEDLKDKRIVQKLTELSEEFIRKHETEGSRELIRYIQEKTETWSDEELALLNVPLANLRFASLSAHPIEEIQIFLEKDAIRVLPHEELDLFRELRDHLIATWPAGRDEKKEQMRQALSKNSEFIGSHKLKSEQEKTENPTGANWIRAYIQEIGAGSHDNVERSRFLHSNAAAKQLNEKERTILADFLYLYDLLKIPSGALGSLDLPDVSHIVAMREGPIGETFDEREERLEKEKSRITKQADVIRTRPETPEDALMQPPSQPPKRTIELPKKKPSKKPPKKPGAMKRQEPMSPKLAGVIKPPPKQSVPQTPPRGQKSIDATAQPKQEKKPQARKQPTPTKKPSAAQKQPQQSSGAFQGLQSVGDIAGLTLTAVRKGDNAIKKIHAVKDQADALLAASPGDVGKARELWKQTELYKLYLDMGNESMTSSKNIAQVSQERQQMKKPSLSPEEFEAVSELSKTFTK